MESEKELTVPAEEPEREAEETEVPEIGEDVDPAKDKGKEVSEETDTEVDRHDDETIGLGNESFIITSF
jgi:hypothetical protein